MSTTQLRAFHLVALAGGFSQAAREMAVSQSTLSGQVRQLEAASGVSLFERKPRGVALTPDGQALFEVTARLFAAESEARAILRGDIRRNGGHLRVAADGAFHSVPILAALQTLRPQLTFTLHIDNSERVIAQLVDYRADVGITARRPADPRLHIRPMLNMGLAIFVPTAHEWAGRRGIAMRELAGRAFVIRERGSVTREVFEQNLADHQVTIETVLEVSTREGVREAVAAGFGIGVVADREFGHDARLVALPVLDAAIRMKEYAICLDERRHLPLVRDFLAKAQLHAQGAELARPEPARVVALAAGQR